MASRNFVISLLISAPLLVLGVLPAHAQLWLETAFPTRTAFGPSKAVGAVVWAHGRSVDSEDYQAPIPPYMATLREGGWDAFRFNRMRGSDTLVNSTRGLVEEVHRL